MLISQITAVDSSNIEYATSRAAEALSTRSGGFSDYLARITDAEYESFAGDVWASEYEAPGVLTNYSTEPFDNTGFAGTETPNEQSASAAVSPESTQPASAASSLGDEKPGDGPDRAEPKSDKSHLNEGGAKQPTKAVDDSADQAKAGSQPGSSSVAGHETNPKQSVRRMGHIETVENAPGHGSGDNGLAVSELRSVTADRPDAVSADGVAVKADRIADIEVNLGERLRTEKPSVSKASDVDIRSRSNLAMTGSDARITRSDAESRQKESQPIERSPRITVKDLRQGSARSGNAEGRGANGEGAADTGVRAGNGSQVTGASGAPGSENATAGDETFSMFAGSRPDGADAQAPRTTTSVVRPFSSPVLHSLRQTLSDQVNGEIVRAARMVVRGNDTGEIRLHLKPETLGNVRITLQMHEGHIAGRIIVENSSVREVFEQNLADLIRAFNESGLETGALDVALTNSGNGTEERTESGHNSRAVKELDRAVPAVRLIEDDHDLVDLVV